MLTEKSPHCLKVTYWQTYQCLNVLLIISWIYVRKVSLSKGVIEEKVKLVKNWQRTGKLEY